MPKPFTYPTLYDDLKTVSITSLSKHGYLKPNQCQSGTINWSINEKNTGSISLIVNTQLPIPYIELNYKNDGEPRNYRVRLVSITSNLGKGVIWYFVCPYTGKHCPKLYLGDTLFLHRLAFKGILYEKQCWSKKWRQTVKVFNYAFIRDEVNKELNQKNYSGNPTKHYLRLLAKIERCEQIPIGQIKSIIGFL